MPDPNVRPTTVTPEEALSRILARVDRLSIVTRPIAEALDHVLAEDVNAPMGLPPHDHSAMDGYAVRTADLSGPRDLVVVGEVRAGHVSDAEVKSGTAMRIMTGATIPHGADAVVAYEETSMPGSSLRQTGPLSSQLPPIVRFNGPIPIGLNIRRAAEDVAKGSRLIRTGEALGPSEIAVLAAIGRDTVRVVARPVVAVLATGDELVEPGRTLAHGQVFNTNSYALGALVVRAGGELMPGGLIRDTLPDLERRLAEVLERADLVITAGGASGGAYDVVAQFAAGNSMIAPLSVRMKPGKPLALGWLGRSAHALGRSIPSLVPFIGLPGSPVAAMVAFELFARPAILKMRGLAELDPATAKAIAAEDLPNRSDRVAFLRVRLSRRDDRCYASAVGLQRSSAISSLLRADGLAEVPGHGRGILQGEEVRVRLIGWSGTPGDGLPYGAAPSTMPSTSRDTDSSTRLQSAAPLPPEPRQHHDAATGKRK